MEEPLHHKISVKGFFCALINDKYPLEESMKLWETFVDFIDSRARRNCGSEGVPALVFIKGKAECVTIQTGQPKETN